MRNISVGMIGQEKPLSACCFISSNHKLSTVL